VWVYLNNNPVGIFDLPVTVPLMLTEPGVVSVSPGISVSGFNSFQAVYPFYSNHTLAVSPQPGKTINYSPITGYRSSVRYKTISNFEIGSTNFSLFSGDVNIGLTGNDPDKFEGNSSGRILLKRPTDTLSESYTSLSFYIPELKDAYLELNYKCDVPFFLGMQSTSGSANYKTYLAGVYPSDGKWKKFYLALKDFVGQYPGDYYVLFLKANLPTGTTTGKVLLDNIQLVYFD
jgi:hypothetical protein